ncbi:MAG: DUF3791 domain-containing protein [Bacteroidales bacterium]|nr:DUF3791 domain-containing protein [Bacteroidales bacterium]
MMYARVILEFAKMMNMDPIKAAALFYASNLYQLVSEGVADLHCRSEYYLAEELKLELQHHRPEI